MTPTRTDPVQLEILRNRFKAIVEEMASVTLRSKAGERTHDTGPREPRAAMGMQPRDQYASGVKGPQRVGSGEGGLSRGGASRNRARARGEVDCS